MQSLEETSTTGSVLEPVIEVDRSLFQTINLDWTNDIFDTVMPIVTDLHKSPYFVLAVLPLLAFWIYRSRKRALKWILVLVMSVGFADLFSYRVVKTLVTRDRPAETGIQVELRTKHHSGKSFPSNHSANMFAAATALSGAFPVGWPFLFFSIAVLIAYSRVYVGVHFPLDVFGGAIIGILIAMIVRWALRKWLDEKSSSARSMEKKAK